MLEFVMNVNDFILGLVKLPSSKKCGSKFLRFLRGNFVARVIFWIVLGITCFVLQVKASQSKAFDSIGSITVMLAYVLFIYDLDDLIRYFKKEKGDSNAEKKHPINTIACAILAVLVLILFFIK